MTEREKELREALSNGLRFARGLEWERLATAAGVAPYEHVDFDANTRRVVDAVFAALRAPASEGEAVLWQYRYRFNALYSPWMRFAGAGEDGWMTMRTREARDEAVTRISDGHTFIVETRDLFTHPAPATVTEAGPWLTKAADRLAGEVLKLTESGKLGTRSPAADALLDYATTRHGQSDPIGKVRAALGGAR